MVIKIVLPDHPDKHRVKPSAIPDSINAQPTEGRFDTEITHNGEIRNKGAKVGSPDSCWDIDVYFTVGVLYVRVPALGREAVSTRDMLYELMRADNGTADAWVRVLLGDADADGLWDRYTEDHPGHPG